jgi:hypothetical protein
MSCAGEPAVSGEVPPESVERAASLAASFKTSLMSELGKGLAEGPEHAIGACSIRAPEIARELSTDGVQIGRTALKLRNPRNAPAPWLVALLEEYSAAGPGAEPRSVRIDAETVGYVEPLYVARPCLTCHGENVDAAVRERIAELYPEDQATGFRAGDFRGLLWVKIRL